jgi:hypothetical protein
VEHPLESALRNPQRWVIQYHLGPGAITGNISPLLRQANQIAETPNGEGFLENASNRRPELQIRFTY